MGYGTLYCASEQVGCLAEALAPFRVHPDWRDLAAADWEDGAPGLVPPDWPTRHTLERLELSKDARFLDVDDERTLTTLSDELRETLRLNGVDKLSRDHIEGFNRKITRAISAWAISQREPEQGAVSSTGSPTGPGSACTSAGRSTTTSPSPGSSRT